jgi:hypothetical protein
MHIKVAADQTKHITLRIPHKLEIIDGDPDIPKPEAEGDIQMEYSCY